MLVESGFAVGKANPALFCHEAEEIIGLVHGDDFVTLADDRGQDFFETCLTKRYQYSIKGRLGPRSTDQREIKVLNRYMRWSENGDLEYEADPRHAQVIARELNLTGGNSVTSPIVKYDLHNDGELKGADVKKFRSLTMTGAYLGSDRYDIQHATKELATEMKTPTQEGMVRLKRLARYLNGAPRLVQTFRRQSEQLQVGDRLKQRSIDLIVDVDSDWAGDRRHRKSTLCVVIRHGVNVIKTQVNAMKGIAMSSGEAEYGAIVKGACQGLGVQSMAADWGIVSSIKVRSDSSAAIGISNRLGLGSMRHLSVRHLWVQDKVKNKEIQLEKQDGKKNVADLGTKIQSGPTIVSVMTRLGYRFERQPLEGALKAK